jgi:hypothetical protein
VDRRHRDQRQRHGPAGTGRRADHPADMAEEYEADADDWNERERAER